MRAVGHPAWCYAVGVTTLGAMFADFCGVERNRFSFERVEWRLVPEHVQEGPFYPTSTPIQIWRIARGQNTNNLFAV